MIDTTTTRKIRRLRNYDGLTWRQIAAVVDISPTTARRTLIPRTPSAAELKRRTQIKALRQRIRLQKRHIEWLEYRLRLVGQENRLKVLESMEIGTWVTVPLIAKSCGMGKTTTQNHVKALVEEGKVEDNGLKNKLRAYKRINTLESGDRH